MHRTNTFGFLPDLHSNLPKYSLIAILAPAANVATHFYSLTRVGNFMKMFKKA